jgi:hypothetical protein
VEDDAASADAMRALFVRRGWDVTVAGSVAEALARLTPEAVYRKPIDVKQLLRLMGGGGVGGWGGAGGFVL